MYKSVQHESTNWLRVIHGPRSCDLPHRGSFKPPKEKNSQGWKHLWLPLTRQRGSLSVGPHRRTRCSPGPRLRRPSGPGRPSSPKHAGPLCWGKRHGENTQWTPICFPKLKEFEVELWEGVRASPLQLVVKGGRPEVQGSRENSAWFSSCWDLVSFSFFRTIWRKLCTPEKCSLVSAI